MRFVALLLLISAAFCLGFITSQYRLNISDANTAQQTHTATAKGDHKDLDSIQQTLCENENWHVKGLYVKNNLNIPMIVDVCDNVVSRANFAEKAGWEPHVAKLIKKIVKPGDKIVTAGTHIGTHMLHFANLTGNNGAVYAFEAMEDTMNFAKLNAVINNFGNIKFFQNAVYDVNSTLRFSSLTNRFANSGESCVMNDKTTARYKTVLVRSITLDEALSSVPYIDILQMDVEGSEPNVIRGATSLIERSPNLKIIQEWDLLLMRILGNNLVEYLQKIRNLGFEIYKITNEGIVPMSNDQLLMEDHCDLFMQRSMR